MAQIATKFVQWDVPELATLQGSRVYKLREHLNNGGKLNREDKMEKPRDFDPFGQTGFAHLWLQYD